MKSKITFISLFAIPLLFTGCASIIDGGPKPIQVNSVPAGATVTIFNHAGKQVVLQTTPTVVDLSRTHGWGLGEDYTLVFEASGYNSYKMDLPTTMDGWYFANILLGGIPGMLVDLTTGDCYTFDTKQVFVSLVPLQAGQTQSQSVLHPTSQTTSEQPISTNAYQQMEQNVINQTTK